MILPYVLKILLSALWQGKQNLPIAGRKHTGHGKRTGSVKNWRKVWWSNRWTEESIGQKESTVDREADECSHE